MKKMSLPEAIAEANRLGFPYAVQQWGEGDYVVCHGAGNGIGQTVYATIRTKVKNSIPGRFHYADAHDMYRLLGLEKNRLPAEGMPERDVHGMRVYVRPLTCPVEQSGWGGRHMRRNWQGLRVMAICECGTHVAVGRLHQHQRVVVRRFNSDTIVGRFCTDDLAQAFIDDQIDIEGGMYMIEHLDHRGRIIR